MNWHPILGPLLSESKQAAQRAMENARHANAKLDEYRYAYVETFLRGLDRAGYAIVPKTGRQAPSEHRQIVLGARFELRQQLRDRIEELDVTQDVDIDDQHPVELVDIDAVRELVGDPANEVNEWQGGERAS